MTVNFNEGRQKNKKLLPATVRSVRSRMSVLNLILFTVVTCFHLLASGQAGNSRTKLKPDDTKKSEQSVNVESVEHFYFDELPKPQRQTAGDFKDFLDKKDLSDVSLLFAPAAAINTAHLKPGSGYNVCIGKQTQKNKNDYVLLLFKDNKSGGSQAGAIKNFRMVSKDATECIIIKYSDFREGGRSGIQAIYSTVTGEQIPGLSGYIQNLEPFLKRYSLRIRYPYTFLFTPKTKNQGKIIYLQASSYKDTQESKKTAELYRSRGEKGSLFTFASMMYEDNYIVINSIDNECCCQIPPM